METVLIVFLLKVIWPDHVFLIRGNREFEAVCQMGGFKSEFMSRYNNSDAFNAIISAFDFMPLAAVVDRSILCVHGGFGPDFKSLEQIRSLSRPIHDFGNDLLDGILWSDPRDEVSTFEQSSRGVGWYFGSEACKNVTSRLKIKILVRAHECVHDGYEMMFDGMLGTVFSASNYCGITGNKSAVLRIQHGIIGAIRFGPLPYLKREHVSYARSGRVVVKKVEKKKIHFVNLCNKFGKKRSQHS